MTSRNNEVRIDIEVEGGAKAERSFNRAEKGARGLGRSTRGLINPFLGAGLVAGILGGGLLGIALSSGAASNSIIRIQGAMEGLVSTITRSLEPAIDFAASRFEKLPIAMQLAVVTRGQYPRHSPGLAHKTGGYRNRRRRYRLGRRRHQDTPGCGRSRGQRRGGQSHNNGG